MSVALLQSRYTLIAVATAVALLAVMGFTAWHHHSHGPLKDEFSGARWKMNTPHDYHPADGGTWSAVLAEWATCTTNRKPFVIDRITYHSKVGGPHGIKVRMYSVRHRAEKDEDLRQGTATGTVETVDWPARGTFHEVEGFRVTQDCSHDLEGNAYDQIVAEISVGPEGRWLDSLTVDYHQGWWHYSDTFPLDDAMSGRAVDASWK